jgi:NAD-dependent deacetylase
MFFRPELFWEMATEMHETMASARPNPAHLALAELEKLGLLSCVITQNVDNLHQVHEST